MSTLSVLITACSEPDLTVRRYQEVVVEAPEHSAAGHDHAAHQGDDPHAGMAMRDLPLPMTAPPASSDPFTWETPEGWREEAGFGMRLVTLWVEADDERAECTLIVLAGDSGGLEANIVRWMGQVNITPPPQPDLRAYVERLESITTAGGLSGVLIDFDEYVESPTALSTLAGIIQRGRETLFVKLTGSKALLAQERDQFIALCESIR